MAFFLNGKKVSCSYGPEARVLKNINTKKLVFSNAALEVLANNALDTTDIKTLLKKGEVDFSESEPRKEPCGIYKIEGPSTNSETLFLNVENCDSIATVINVKMLPSGR